MILFEQIYQVPHSPQNIFAMIIVVMIAVAVFCGNFIIINIECRMHFLKFSFHSIVSSKENFVSFKEKSILKVNSI